MLALFTRLTIACFYGQHDGGQMQLWLLVWPFDFRHQHQCSLGFRWLTSGASPMSRLQSAVTWLAAAANARSFDPERSSTAGFGFS